MMSNKFNAIVEFIYSEYSGLLRIYSFVVKYAKHSKELRSGYIMNEMFKKLSTITTCNYSKKEIMLPLLVI